MNRLFFLFVVALSFVSCYREEERSDSCEKNMIGEYCIEIAFPYSSLYGYKTDAIFYYSIEDKESRVLLEVDHTGIKSSVNSGFCITIPLTMPAKRRIIKINYRVDNPVLTNAPFKIDTIRLCERTPRVINF